MKEKRKPQPYGEFLMHLHRSLDSKGIRHGVKEELANIPDTSQKLIKMKPIERDEAALVTKVREELHSLMVGEFILKGIVLYEATRRVVGVNTLPSTYSLAKRVLQMPLFAGLETQTGGGNSSSQLGPIEIGEVDYLEEGNGHNKIGDSLFGESYEGYDEYNP